MATSWTWCFSLQCFLVVFLVFCTGMAYVNARGRGVRTRGGRGGSFQGSARYTRSDNNLFSVLSDPATRQNGDDHDDHEAFTSDPDDDFIVVRGKRQRISTGGKSNELNLPFDEPPNYDALTSEDKISLILSKVSLNEGRVIEIQNKLEAVIDLKQRVDSVERVLRSNTDRIKLLEYRSIDIEARSRRRNILFKGIAENRRENCFEVVRDFIHGRLNIDRDMYLERAHRLGRYDNSKIRPIIVAFRDYCDVDEIMESASNLKGSSYGVSRDYPKEISQARQSLWWKFKELRENNPNKKVTLEYPAKVTVDNVVVADMFPDWFSILKGSRVDMSYMQRSKQTNPIVNADTFDRSSMNEPNVNDLTPRSTGATRTGPYLNENSSPVNRQSPNTMDYEEHSPPHSQSILAEPMPPPSVPSMGGNCGNSPNIKLNGNNGGINRGRSSTRKINANQRPRSKSINVRSCSQGPIVSATAKGSLSAGKHVSKSPNQNPSGPTKIRNKTGSGVRDASQKRSASRQQKQSTSGREQASNSSNISQSDTTPNDANSNDKTDGR